MGESILYLPISLLDGREDNIRVDLREIGWDGVDWIYLAQDMIKCRARMRWLGS